MGWFVDEPPPDVQFNHHGYLFLATPEKVAKLDELVKMQRYWHVYFMLYWNKESVRSENLWPKNGPTFVKCILKVYAKFNQSHFKNKESKMNNTNNLSILPSGNLRQVSWNLLYVCVFYVQVSRGRSGTVFSREAQTEVSLVKPWWHWSRLSRYQSSI